MNPFEYKPRPVMDGFGNFSEIYPKAYNKNETDPYTKARIILMNGTEFEANWFSHCFLRHITDNDLRREISLVRAVEKQQQQKLALLKPCNESPLEHTIAYEQLAVDLTAELAKREKDCYVKKALDFALLEDFDHLYRYANQLEMEQGIQAERLVGRYTEIMPGRPTIAHHRFPKDNVKRKICSKTADKQTVLSTMIITAAEQQTMNYYMNISNFAANDAARRLYEEIALVEEEHVTQYGSLVDSDATWLEMLLWHEYVECYLYWSCFVTETDRNIKCIWEQRLETEISHLHKAAQLLEKYDNKHWQQVIGDGEFPRPLELHENISYVRNILADTVRFTGYREDYECLDKLPRDAEFFRYQKLLIPDVEIVQSHIVIDKHIQLCGKDYRYETKPNPHIELQDRFSDNVMVGRVPGAAGSTNFKCNQ
ncbi:MAG: hypothetical protein IKU54_04450 [Oscillospiraceae bacterium]|nr:hypothetical protein [Oscillospiraceae bacterium]